MSGDDRPDVRWPPPVPSPTALEMHSGLVLGAVSSAWQGGPQVLSEASGARTALEDVISGALRRGPCVVRFSGGRDSSLVLAVAAHVARRDGYPLPSALSVRYPDDPTTHESDWQDLVVRHVRVPHEIVEVRRGVNELAAPMGVSQLLRHGPLIPPTCGASLACIGGAVGGRTVLTGEGGDEVLGESRITQYVFHWRRRRRPSIGVAGEMMVGLLPAALRRMLAKRALQERRETTWLVPRVERAVWDGLVESAVDDPWDWRTARWQAPRSRLWAVGSAALDKVARSEGFEIRHPLLDPRFVSAVCTQGGARGFTTRTEGMRILAGDLLPEAVLTRKGKARFNEVYAGDRVRQFATEWDGSGVDRDLVDVTRLRAVWSTTSAIPAPSLAPLQLALLGATAQGWEPRSVRSSSA